MEVRFGMLAQNKHLRGHHAGHKGISASRLYCGALRLGRKMGTTRQIFCEDVFHPNGPFLSSWSAKKIQTPMQASSQPIT